MRISRNPPERSFDSVPSVVFMVFTLIGAVYIVIAKIVGLESWIVTSVPVALMIGYALMVLGFRRLRQRDDQTGDNFYYMGFIYTLVSLGVSLYQYNSGSGVEDIVQNFGVAIASTIVGIVLRIFFNQLRRDPIEIEQVSRLDLADASRDVRRQLEQVSQELAHFRRTNQQMIDEGVSESQTQLETLAQRAITSIEKIAETARDGMQSSTVEFGEQISAAPLRRELDRAAESLEKVSSLLEDSVGNVSKATSELSEKISAMKPPDEVLEIKFQPVIDGLEKVISKALDGMETQTEQIIQLQKSILVSADTLKDSAITNERLAGRKSSRSRGGNKERRGLFGLFRRTNHNAGQHAVPRDGHLSVKDEQGILSEVREEANAQSVKSNS